jgi:hypothetical protein
MNCAPSLESDMLAEPPSIMPILATPLGIAVIPGAEELNLSLRDLFARRMESDTRPTQNPLRFFSEENLMDWPEQPIRMLSETMIGAVYAFLGSVSNIDDAQLRSCKLETRAWFSVIRTNGSVPAANYPLTSWCAIYCVAAPRLPDVREDGGVLRLYESRLGTTFQDATNSVMRIPYSSSHYAWRPVAGRMVIFPASLTHEIALMRASGELILVTARLRFTAPGQQGFQRW